MSYSHRMSASFDFIPGITKHQIYEAFKPLTEYWGGADRMIRFAIKQKEKDGIPCKTVQIETNGDVSFNYCGIINSCARNLDNIINTPDYFLLIDDETAEIDNISRIWAGDSQDVDTAKRLWAWEEAKEVMSANGYTSEELAPLEAMVLGLIEEPLEKKEEIMPKSSASF